MPAPTKEMQIFKKRSRIHFCNFTLLNHEIKNIIVCIVVCVCVCVCLGIIVCVPFNKYNKTGIKLHKLYILAAKLHMNATQWHCCAYSVCKTVCVHACMGKILPSTNTYAVHMPYAAARCWHLTALNVCRSVGPFLLSYWILLRRLCAVNPCLIN